MVLAWFRSLKAKVAAFWPAVTVFCHVIFSIGPHRTTHLHYPRKQIVVLLNVNVVCLGVFRLMGEKQPDKTQHYGITSKAGRFLALSVEF